MVIRTRRAPKSMTRAASSSTVMTRPRPYLSCVTWSCSANCSAGGAGGAAAKGLVGRWRRVAARAGFIITSMRLRTSPLQRLGDPLPATRLVVHRPRQEGACRVGQFGDDTDQLAVKIVRPALLLVCPVRDDRHDRTLRAGQPDDDVAVVVQAGHRDIPGADDLGTLIVRDPYVGHVPASSRPCAALRGLCPLPSAIAAGRAAGSPGGRSPRRWSAAADSRVTVASVTASRSSTSPTVRSRAVGSGSGRWAWMW